MSCPSSRMLALNRARRGESFSLWHQSRFPSGNRIDTSARRLRHARPQTTPADAPGSPLGILGLLGKFRIVASHHAPLHRKSRVAFPLPLNLPEGPAPLDPPARVSPSAHRSTLTDSGYVERSTGPSSIPFRQFVSGFAPAPYQRVAPFGFLLIARAVHRLCASACKCISHLLTQSVYKSIERSFAK